MVGSDSGYFLTYDLKILYCPSMQIANICKELNVDTKAFTPFDGNMAILADSYKLNKEDVENIVDNVLTGKIGEELPTENMNWLITFENLLKDDPSLITNRELAFNYFILKFVLMGFSADMAKDIVVTYYEHIIREDDVPHPQILLNQINKFLTYKKFWIKYNLKDEKLKEFKMMKKIIKTKQELENKINRNFNFDQMFKKEYLEVIGYSFVPVLIKFNQTEGYLVKEKSDLNTLIPYVTQVYQEIILGIIYKICDIDEIAYDEVFFSNLIKEMTSVVKLYLTLHSNEFTV